MDIIKQVREFFSYWYLRYLVATELYMVEPWEKNFIHIIMLVAFGLFWYFNCNFIVHSISNFRCSTTNMQSIS